MDQTVIYGGLTGSVPGSQRYSCYRCRGDAWLGPASQKMLAKDRSIQIICIHCYLTNDTLAGVDPLPVDQDELVEVFGSKEEADKQAEETMKLLKGIKNSNRPLEPWKKN